MPKRFAVEVSIDRRINELTRLQTYKMHAVSEKWMKGSGYMSMQTPRIGRIHGNSQPFCRQPKLL